MLVILYLLNDPISWWVQFNFLELYDISCGNLLLYELSSLLCKVDFMEVTLCEHGFVNIELYFLLKLELKGVII
jgi:hypothetical protein